MRTRASQLLVTIGAATALALLLGDDDAVTSVVEWALWYVSTFEED